jgi:hypothetical protein
LLAESWNGVCYITTSDRFQKARFCEIPDHHHEEYDRNKSRHLRRYCGYLVQFKKLKIAALAMGI